MSDKDREEFMQWYNTVREGVFDLQLQLHQYGNSDVVVLRKACFVYRQAFMECAELDPFQYTTLASCCMAVFKTHFLPPTHWH